MQTPKPGTIPAMEAEAVDLSDAAARLERERLEREAAAEAEARLRVERWDRAMQRTFKGIVSRPQRHAQMMRALKIQEHGE